MLTKLKNIQITLWFPGPYKDNPVVSRAFTFCMLPFFLLYSLAFQSHKLSVVRSTDQSTTSEFKDWQNFIALELTMIQRPASAQPKTRKGKAGKRKIRYWIFETKALCILCCSKWIPYEGDLSFQVSYESIFFVWRKTKQRENFQLYSGRRE